MVRIESQFIHAMVVKPAPALLTAKENAEDNAESLKALELDRKGETKPRKCWPSWWAVAGA